VKRNRKGSKPEPQTIQVWTYDQAMHVLPYVGSIMASLREYQLDAIRHQLHASRLASKEGRPRRADLIAHQEASAAAGAAEEKLHNALEELHDLDIYCLDPVHGQALIPFAVGDDLAWYVFDLFDPGTLRYWRYHRDSVETRRAITGKTLPPPADDSVMI
jgi:hypothetical protein